MRLLLNTQLALWWLTESARVSATLHDLIENAADAVFVSRASLWELAIKIGTGRLRVDADAKLARYGSTIRLV